MEHDETTDLIASNKVEGTTVYNRKGEKLGDVHNFMVGKRSGQVAYAVMSFGGILGLGQTYHALPWSALTYDEDKGGYVIDADKDRITAAPSFKAGEEPFARPGYGRDIRVVTEGCPGLVEQIERGELDSPATRSLLEKYLQPLLEANADTIVLGCTHYPFVRPLIQELAGPAITLIDTGDAGISRRDFVIADGILR